MSELETLKKENETLQNQMAENNRGAQNLMYQLDAHKGELADARTITMQLRLNLVTAQHAANFFQEQIKKLQTELEEVKEKLKNLEEVKPSDETTESY